jgi:hypothetical protein
VAATRSCALEPTVPFERLFLGAPGMGGLRREGLDAQGAGFENLGGDGVRLPDDDLERSSASVSERVRQRA